MQHRENILVDFRRQFDYIDFTCIATSCFQNVYDNALTTTHTHTPNSDTADWFIINIIRQI